MIGEMNGRLSPQSMPGVSVVIATLGRFGPLLDCLDDLLAQEIVPTEIVVVDQNVGWPADVEGRRELVSRDPRIIWLSGIPPGVVAARNLGVERSSAAIVVFVDDDVRIPDPRFLAMHVNAYRDTSVMAVCGRELQPPMGLSVAAPEYGTHRGQPTPLSVGPPVIQLLRFDRSSTEGAAVAVFSTCNGSVRREAFLSVGGFDENFSGASYGDDADLVLRMHAAGLHVVYDPRPWLVHLMMPTGGLRLSDPRNQFSEADRALSGWIFALRHGRGRVFWALVYGWVLRRTLLLKRNAMRPWRWPRIMVGLVRSLRGAHKAVSRGPFSRFTRMTSNTTVVRGPTSGSTD
jgi:GT2 family glycosyltransferase